MDTFATLPGDGRLFNISACAPTERFAFVLCFAEVPISYCGMLEDPVTCTCGVAKPMTLGLSITSERIGHVCLHVKSTTYEELNVICLNWSTSRFCRQHLPPCTLSTLFFAPAAATPLTDQFMASAWPSDGVPWVPGSSSLRSLLPSGRGTKNTTPQGTLKAITSPSKNNTGTAGGGRGEGSRGERGGVGRVSTADAAALGQDESTLHARFACGVPGCQHRFSEARLLGLHLRMGHSDFDLDRMKAAREGTGANSTLDGVSVTAWIDVGGNLRLVLGRPRGDGHRTTSGFTSKFVDTVQ